LPRRTDRERSEAPSPAAASEWLRTALLTPLRQLAGVCILPDFLAGEQSGLQPVLRKPFTLTRTFWIVAHENTAALKRIRETIDFVKDEVRASKDIF